MFNEIIYMYTSPSGKIYIGQTKNERDRKSQHKSKAKFGSKLPFHKAIRKYGFDNFDYVVLCHCKDREEVDKMEMYFIDKYNSTDRNIGYNVVKGGKGSVGLVGSSNPHSKPIEYFETHSSLRANFKRTCKRMGWNFDDFKEVISKDVNDTSRKYFYFYVGEGKGHHSNVRCMKDMYSYINTPTQRAHFKRTCTRHCWNFDDFEEVESEVKSSNGAKKYYYIYKGDKDED